MKKKTWLLLIICVLTILCLCSCGKQVEPMPTTTPEPTATPEPTPEPTPAPVNILGKEVTLQEIEDGYTFELFGQEVNTKETTELHYRKVNIGDAGLNTFREVLPYLKNLKYLTFDRCETTDKEVAKLRDEFPDANIAWRVFFSPFSCMTDVETIWASCDLRDEVTEPLRYCNKVKNLDIGHNAIHDLWFLEYMPDLEVLIISCSEISDISQLKFCKKLIYLEVAETYVRDISPIAQCETLEYLNIGGNNNMDHKTISSLYNLKHLKRFYLGNYFCYEIDLGAEEEKVQALMPECEVNFHEAHTVGTLNVTWRYKRGPLEGGYTDMYIWLRGIFGYDNPYGQTRLYEWMEDQ